MSKVSKWETKRLGEYIKINPSLISLKCNVGEIKYLDISSVSKGSISEYTTYDISEAPSRARRTIKPQDTIFSTVRPNLRAYCYIKECPTNAIVSTGFAVVRAKSCADSRFIYYLITENSFVDYLSLVAKGSAYPAVDSKDFLKAKVSIPPLPTQRRIAEILSAYDDLIENNNRRIALLEKAVQELYKEWFVRFRFPGHETTKFVNGLPEGWEVKKVGEICRTIGGGTPSTQIAAYYDDGNILWVTPTDITKNNCLVVLDTEKKITESALANSSTKLLPPETILMTSRASVGFFGICEHEVCTNQGFISCIPNKDNTRMFLLLNLLSRTEEIRQKSSGATYPEINKKTFRNLNIFIPSADLLDNFQALTYPILKQIRVIAKLNVKLKQARDMLLPRLMSGKLEV